MLHKMIIDTDPGIDDAMAIFTAIAHDEIDLLGLTTTFGNVSVAQATQNALHLVEMAGVDIPVAMGVAAPLLLPVKGYPDFVHGQDGFGNVSLGKPKREAISQGAAHFIVEQIMNNPHEVNLVAIGPLGNVALALQLEPRITQYVKQVVLMGGAVATDGNVSPVAEANIFSDPHAADKVMAADWPVVMVGLDVTHQVVLSRELFAEIGEKNPQVGQFMQQSAQFYMHFYHQVRGIDGCYGHDVSAVVYVVKPDLFTTETGSICVASEGFARGQTIMDRVGLGTFAFPDWGQRPKHQACMGVDAAGLIALFRQCMINASWEKKAC